MKIPFTDINLGLYNVLSCKGFEESASIGISFGPCAYAKLTLVAVFFINAFVRKWIGEAFGIDYSFLGGSIGGILCALLLLTFTGSSMFGFIGGIIGILIFGFGSAVIFGGGDDE